MEPTGSFIGTYNLMNTYRGTDPDIILINSHSLGDDESLKMYSYTPHKFNTSNEIHDRSAILVKSTIQHKIIDDFMTRHTAGYSSN